VNEIITEKLNVLAALTVLTKICNDPLLLKNQLAEMSEDDPHRHQTATSDINALMNHSLRKLLKQTPHLLSPPSKLVVLLDLLARLKSNGHRALLFSQSLKMLNTIEERLLEHHFTLIRIDGSVTDRRERQRRVDDFNKGIGDVCLLTTKIGVGITLTAADRVVIYEPCWNPSSDMQAVDRAYRVGQTKVIINMDLFFLSVFNIIPFFCWGSVETLKYIISKR